MVRLPRYATSAYASMPRMRSAWLADYDGFPFLDERRTDFEGLHRSAQDGGFLALGSPCAVLCEDLALSNRRGLCVYLD